MNDDRALGTDGKHGNDGVSGYALISGVIPGDWSSLLREEAKGLRSTAERRERQGFKSHRRGQNARRAPKLVRRRRICGQGCCRAGRLTSRLAQWSGTPHCSPCTPHTSTTLAATTWHSTGITSAVRSRCSRGSPVPPALCTSIPSFGSSMNRASFARPRNGMAIRREG